MYKMTNHGARRLADGAEIPADEGNADWCAFLAWQQAGGVAVPADSTSAATRARAALSALEQATMMNKGMREFFLVSMQDMAIRKAEQMQANGIEATPQAILAATPAWVKLVAINTQAHALELEANA